MEQPRRKEVFPYRLYPIVDAEAVQQELRELMSQAKSKLVLSRLQQSLSDDSRLRREVINLDKQFKPQELRNKESEKEQKQGDISLNEQNILLLQLIDDIKTTDLKSNQILNQVFFPRTPEPEDSKSFDEIRKHIANNNLKEALEILLKQSSGTNYENDVLLLQARFNSLNKSIRQGTLSNSEIQIQSAQITNSTLELISTMERDEIA